MADSATLKPCELVLSRYRETTPSWLHGLQDSIPVSIYTQGNGSLLNISTVNEERMGTNVGREAFVYLTHLLRYGVRAQQTLFCQIHPHDPAESLRYKHSSLGPFESQHFDYRSTLDALGCTDGNPTVHVDATLSRLSGNATLKPADFEGLTYLWSGLKAIPKFHGLGRRPSVCECVPAMVSYPT